MEQDKKLHFFKRMKIAIFNLEDYGKFLGEHGLQAVKYFLLLVLVFSCIYGISNTYYFNNGITRMKNYIKNELPDFTLSNNKLQMDRKVEAYDEDYKIKLFVDTDPNITEETVKKYKSQVYLNEYGLIFLENEMIFLYKDNSKSFNDVKNINDFIDYLFKSNTNETEIELFRQSYESFDEAYDMTINNKSDLINGLEGYNVVLITIINYISITIGTFILKLFYTLYEVILIAIFGYIVALFCKIKFKWQAPAILSVYSLTLSILLSALYSLIYRFTGFEIKYFDTMYLLIAYVYIVAAIFMIRTDIIRDATELQKIYEEQQKVKEEQENLDEERDSEKQNQDKERKKDKDDKNDEEKKDGETEEGLDVNTREPDGSEI